MNFISMFHPKRIGATVEMRTASDLSPFEGQRSKEFTRAVGKAGVEQFLG